MNKTTIEAVLRAANCCGDDATRYHLTHVAVDAGKEAGQVRLRSTDGHCLVQMLVVDPEFRDALGQKTVVVSESNRRMLKELIRGTKYSLQYPADADSMGLRIGLKDVSTLLLFEEHVAKYPDTDRIVPTSKPAYRLAFNVDRLMDIAKAICTGKDKIVTIDVGEDPVRCPLRVNGSDPSQQWGLLMPCHIDKLGAK